MESIKMPENDEKCIYASLFRCNSVGYLRIVFTYLFIHFFDSNVYKRLVNVCEKFWENMLKSF